MPPTCNSFHQDAPHLDITERTVHPIVRIIVWKVTVTLQMELVWNVKLDTAELFAMRVNMLKNVMIHVRTESLETEENV